MNEEMNTHAILITVLSLLMIVVYGEDAYDGWDLVLSTAASWFGFGFISSEIPKDKFASILGSLIVSIGSWTAIVSLASIAKFPEIHLSIEKCTWSHLSIQFIISMLFTGLAYVFVKNKK